LARGPLLRAGLFGFDWLGRRLVERNCIGIANSIEIAGFGNHVWSNILPFVTDNPRHTGEWLQLFAIMYLIGINSLSRN
jgi:hypothetical protein